MTTAIWHLIFSLMALGYGFEYYFHLSMSANAPLMMACD